MNRYIDADKHLQKLGERRDTAIIWELNCNDEATKDRAQEAILIFNECILELINAPTADVVEVVRCKDCKHRPIDTQEEGNGFDYEFPEEYGCPGYCDDGYYAQRFDDNFFCAWAEKRADI